MLNRLKSYSKALLRQQQRTYKKELNFDITEITALACRRSQYAWKRLNLLIPALSARYVFGGVRTALDFFSALMVSLPSARIIVTDESGSDLTGIADWPGWTTVDAEQDLKAERQVVCIGNRYGRSIPVAKDDVFLATAWWTAYLGERIQQWQESTYGTPPAPMIYCIQDFEPGFYKWSSRYLLAESTYRNQHIIPVINSSSLARYFASQGFNFDRPFVFNPVMHPVLKAKAAKLSAAPRKKQIVFYGRPSVERNAIELIMAALQIWSDAYPEATEWSIVSAGEDYPPPMHGAGARISVMGKLSMTDYANLLSESAIGIALMVSPHPSYPPIEMALFGMQVISNSFPEKDLSEQYPGITSLQSVTPETIASALEALCRQITVQGAKPYIPVFAGSSVPFPFVNEVLQKAGL